MLNNCLEKAISPSERFASRHKQAITKTEEKEIIHFYRLEKKRKTHLRLSFYRLKKQKSPQRSSNLPQITKLLIAGLEIE